MSSRKSAEANEHESPRGLVEGQRVHFQSRLQEIVVSERKQPAARSLLERFGHLHQRPTIRRRFSEAIQGPECVGQLEVAPTFDFGSDDAVGELVGSDMRTWFSRVDAAEGEIAIGASVGHFDGNEFPPLIVDNGWRANTASGWLLKKLQRPEIVPAGSVVQVCVEFSRPAWASWGQLERTGTRPFGVGYLGIAWMRIHGPALTRASSDTSVFVARRKARAFGGLELDLVNPRFTLTASSTVRPGPSEMWIELAAHVWAYREGAGNEPAFASIRLGPGPHPDEFSNSLKVSAISVVYCPNPGPSFSGGGGLVR